MTKIILAALFSGIFSGYFILPHSIISNLDSISTFALGFFILSVGIDVGSNKKVFKDLKNMGLRILIVPFTVIVGSLVGGFICSILFKIPANVGMSIVSGFGWYSLSGIILSKLCSVEIGTIAFLSNVFRELISVISIPFIAKHLNFSSAVSVAGATSMDSTLPVVAEATDEQTVVISFISGAILTALVPILVPLIYGLKF